MNTTSTRSFDLRLRAPAKINLILRVVGKRADGYHELETWMQKIALYDIISLRINDQPGIEFDCTDSELPMGPANLVWRAADLYLANSRKAKGRGVSVHLEKHIPVAAGLGGGSSDAGTTLKGLNRHFGDEFTEQELLQIALDLGADVPFFTTDMGSVLATGIGEKMVAVAPPLNCTYLLVNPGFSVSTATIYEKFALTRVDKNSTLTGFRKLHPDKLSLSGLENDLEAITTELFPVIAEIKEELRAAGADHVLMSGSGPTVFGVFTGSSKERNEVIARAAKMVRQNFGDGVFTAG